MRLPRLLLITDRRQTPGSLVEAVGSALQALPAGSAAVLLREKDLDGGPLLKLARELRAVTVRHESPLLISSRWDVALAANADGVHLGGDAPAIADVRAQVGDALLLGASLHQDEQAPAGADYAFISPIYATRSKPGVAPLGLDGLTRSVERSKGTLLFALGGISTPEQIADCLSAGAYGVAVLGAVLTSTDPGAQARLLYQGFVHAECAVAP